MKLLTWNCNGALRNKLTTLDALSADILIIQECEDPQYHSQYCEWAGDYLWIGNSKSKGIGIFPKNGNRVTSLSWHGSFSIAGLSAVHVSTHWSTSDLQLMLPFRINDALTVLAVWTKGNSKESFSYIGQLWKYLQIHRKDMSGPRTLLLGDLNSNTIWDKPDRWWSHSGVVAELTQIGMQSVYHHTKQEPQGKESEPTFFLHRNTQKPYHIDYVFASSDILPDCTLHVGRASDWLSLSDHVPLVAAIDS